MPTLRTVTLGCKVNQYETEYLREGFLRLGYRDAEDGEPANLCIFNTCTVTSQADSECRKILRRLARENPQAEIIVMGCFATKAPQEIRSLPGVSEVLTNKRQMRELLARRGLVENARCGNCWPDGDLLTFPQGCPASPNDIAPTSKYKTVVLQGVVIALSPAYGEGYGAAHRGRSSMKSPV